MARPKVQPDLRAEQVRELATIGCSDEEIARVAGVSESTLQRRFDTHLKDGRASLRERLRRAQIERALNGSDTMLIWLGKQYLDQRDKADNQQSGAIRVIIDYADPAPPASGSAPGDEPGAAL